MESFLKGYKKSFSLFTKHFLLDFLVRGDKHMPVEECFRGANGVRVGLWIEPYVCQMINNRTPGVPIKDVAYTALLQFVTKWQLEVALKKAKRRHCRI